MNFPNYPKLPLFISWISVCCILGCGYTPLPQKKSTLIKKIDLEYGESERSVFIFRAYSSATVNDAIFIKAQEKDEFATHIFSRYDSLAHFSVERDSLRLILMNIGTSLEIVDTVVVPMEEIFR